MAKINFTEILINTGGAVAGGVAGGMLKKLPVSGVVANGAGVLVGAILPVIAPKNALIKSVATGIAAVAGRNLVSSFVPAIGDDFDSSVGIPTMRWETSTMKSRRQWRLTLQVFRTEIWTTKRYNQLNN